MHLTFTVFCLLIAHVICYPSVRNVEADDDKNNEDLQLELRSILNYLDNEQIERSITSSESDSNENGDVFTKRKDSYNVINPELKCGIECVGKLRNPETGKGLSVGEATKACNKICADLFKNK
ncbi:unnamed protein product [Adineta ricciae]|uniref:Uncharacterized protein n=1 Tax=Adineta ricciae TaxID=249248 RepID=A0A814UYP4_ADIRI|nr:unnamed protein product [Adineta ricciae]CAF1641508.1 unnamed protein product [Adineta ricciae]